MTKDKGGFFHDPDDDVHDIDGPNPFGTAAEWREFLKDLEGIGPISKHMRELIETAKLRIAEKEERERRVAERQAREKKGASIAEPGGSKKDEDQK